MADEKGIIHLSDMTRDKSVTLDLARQLKREIKQRIEKQYQSVDNFKKKFKIKCDLHTFLSAQQSIGIMTLNSILINLDMGLYEVEKKVLRIGTKTGHAIQNPRLPFNFNSKEGFLVIAAIFGDGALSRQFIASYGNNYPHLVQKVKYCALAVFGEIDGIWEGRKGKFHMLSFPAIVGRIINKLDIPRGTRAITNPHLPPFILTGSYENKIEFLKQISDDEGSPQINPPYSYSVRFNFSVYQRFGVPPLTTNLSTDLRKLFCSLGYNCSRVYIADVYPIQDGRGQQSYQSYSWAFNIQGKNFLERFEREVGFSIPPKRSKLLMGLSKIQRNQLGTKRMYKTALDKVKIVCSRDGFVTKHTLAKEANISLRNSIAWLSKLQQKKRVKVTRAHSFIRNGESTRSFQGRTPNEYGLV